MKKPTELTTFSIGILAYFWFVTVLGFVFYSLRILSLEKGCNTEMHKFLRMDEIFVESICFLAQTKFYLYFWTLFAGWILTPCVMLLMIMQGEMILPKLESHKVQKVE